MGKCKDCMHTKGNDVSNFPCIGCYSNLNRDRPNFKKAIKTKIKPEVIITSLYLECPICYKRLTYDTCSNCGQEIDISEMMIDIQVSEILDHDDMR